MDISDLTLRQKQALLLANEENDWHVVDHGRVLTKLEEMNLATFTSDLAHKYGSVVKLTDKGIEMVKLWQKKKTK